MKSLAATLILVPISAFAQLASPPVCNMGMPCVVDSHGSFVGVGSGPVITVTFSGIKYTLDIGHLGLPKGGVFYYPNADCGGTPMLQDIADAIPHATVDISGTVYGPQRPHPRGLKAVSVSSPGLSGDCITYSTIGDTLGLTPALVIDKTVANSWVPPFTSK